MSEQLAVVSASVFAVVAGQPYSEVPKDLFIPPDALLVWLDRFSGPLDLLLYLIRRQNIDILDVPIALITQQYMEYIQLMEAHRLDLASDYLVMAATLAEIKSRLLLPLPSHSQDEVEDDPRLALIRKLQAYEQIKNAAVLIDDLPRCERDVFRFAINLDNPGCETSHPDVELSLLTGAMHDLMKRQSHVIHHQIKRELLSVRERMVTILERLHQEKTIAFVQLINQREGRMGLVVSLLAILGLARQSLLIIIQTSALLRFTYKMLIMVDNEVKQIVEALLMSSSIPLPLEQLQAVFDEWQKPSCEQLRALLAELAKDYEKSVIELKSLASGYCLQTKAKYSPWINRLQAEKPAKYSRALLETLAIIAYRQPVTRGDIEDIRGVTVSSSILKTLLEREWIKVAGHRDVPGKPAVYVTTKLFLDYFNLVSLDELPVLPEAAALQPKEECI